MPAVLLIITFASSGQMPTEYYHHNYLRNSSYIRDLPQDSLNHTLRTTVVEQWKQTLISENHAKVLSTSSTDFSPFFCCCCLFLGYFSLSVTFLLSLSFSLHLAETLYLTDLVRHQMDLKEMVITKEKY